MMAQPVSTFGKKLRTAREAHGLSLDAVAQFTKISLHVLRNIENEAHEKLPNPAFVRGFIRLYADAVNLDPDTVVEDYTIERRAFEKALALGSRASGVGGRFWTHMLMSLGALICMMSLTLYLISDVDKEISEEVVYEEPRTPLAEPAPHRQPQPMAAPPAVSPQPAAVKPDGWKLSVTTLEPTWMKVIMDNDAPRAYSLKPGDEMELKAENGFNILIGDAAGVKLKLNDKPVIVRGKHGQVTTLQLP